MLKKSNFFYVLCLLTLTSIVAMTLVSCTGIQQTPFQKYVNSYTLPIDVQNVPAEFTLPKKDGEVTIKWSASEWFVVEETDTSFVFKISPDLKAEKNVTIKGEFSNGSETTVRNFRISIIPAKSIVRFLDAEEGAVCTVTGVVYQKASQDYPGYFIYDQTGTAFVYNSNKDVNIGDEVEITGVKSVYYNLPQLKYADKATGLKLISSDNEILTFENSTIREMYELDQNDVTVYGKNYRVQGLVKSKVVDFVTNFYLEDAVTQQEINIYYMSRQDIVAQYVGKYVELDLTIYSYNSSTSQWQVFFNKTTEQSIVEIDNPTLSVAEQLEAVKTVITGDYAGKTYYANTENVELPLNSLYDSELVWSSSNEEVIDNSGIIGDVTSEQNVTLTVTVKIASEEINFPVAITIKPLVLQSIYDINRLPLTTATEVMFKGVVNGLYGTSGYFVSVDNEGIYVKGNTLDIQVGDEVIVVGSLSNSKKEVKSQPIVQDKTYEKVLSKNNQIDEAVKYTLAEIAKETIDSVLYNKYIAIEATLATKSGSYGNTYSLVDGDNSISFQGNSNTYGLFYLANQKVLVKGYLYAFSNGSFNFHLANREGDLESLETPTSVVTQSAAYLDTVLPNDVDLNVNLSLPQTHPVYTNVVYTYQSTNEAVLSSNGMYLNPSQETVVTLNVTISLDSIVEHKSYTYNVVPGNATGFNDLVFSYIQLGGANDKIFAIYNGTGRNIDLTNYRIGSVQNSGTGANTYTISLENAQGVLDLGKAFKELQTSRSEEADGILEAGRTIVIYHVSVTRGYLDNLPADTYKISTPNTNGVASFNGSDGDVVVLMRGTVLVDMIGTIVRGVKGAPTPWEGQYLQRGLMLVRNINNQKNAPELDWNNPEEVVKLWGSYEIYGTDHEYHLPVICYDFANGKELPGRLN